MTQFSVHFRELVMPRLRNLAAAEALCVVKRVQDFNEAWDAVWAHARNHGAVYLPAHMVDQLDDWICTTLLTEIDRLEKDGGGVG